MDTATQQTSDGITPSRTAGVAISGVVGYVFGFYAGIFVLLSVVGFNDLEGWQFELASVPMGSLVAGFAAAVSGPATGRSMAPALGTALVTAAGVVPILYTLDGDFLSALIIGGVLGVGAVTTAVVTVSRSGDD